MTTASTPGPATTRFVVGLDGSHAAAAALRWGAALAAVHDAAILCVHAWTPGDADRGTSAPTAEAARQAAQVWIDDVLPGGSDEIEVVVERGDPRQVLCAVSERERPDLVVVGRGRHHLGTGPEHLGRVAGYVARHNPWPLAVIPTGTRHRQPRVVIGVDGSTGARAAVEWCAQFAPALGATVVAVDVDESGAPAGTWQHDADHRARIDAEIMRSVEPLTAAELEVERTSVLHQVPADALLHVADTRQADIVIIGTRGRGGFDELQVGGTALELLGRAHVPLVLVPGRRNGHAPDAPGPA